MLKDLGKFRALLDREPLTKNKKFTLVEGDMKHDLYFLTCFMSFSNPGIQVNMKKYVENVEDTKKYVRNMKRYVGNTRKTSEKNFELSPSK